MFGRSKPGEDDPGDPAPVQTFPDAPTYGIAPDAAAASQPDAEASGEPAPAGAGTAADADPPRATDAPPVRSAGRERPGVMIPARNARSTVESFFMRIIATAGIVAIGVVIAAIMTSSHSRGWIIGLVVAIVTVVLSAVLWSSQRL